ncbi:MAG: DNA polymerase/3'-5' exonuclease PolX [Methanomassiliicoccales archaeon]
MNNAEIAGILDEIGDLLELKEESVFKVRSYRRAARGIESLEVPAQRYHEEGMLEDVPGVGKAIASKVGELLETGELGYLNDLREEFPTGLLEIMRIPEIGPKTTLRLYRELGVETVDDLERAAREGKVRELKGFGASSEGNMLRGIELFRRRTGRLLLGQAYPAAEGLIHFLMEGDLERVNIAGSLRRMRETIGDIDLLVGSDRPEEVMDLYLSFPEITQVISRGRTKSSIRLGRDLQVDLRVVSPESYGAALQYFTGSKDHNVRLRTRAIELGYKINEYGVFDKGTGERLGGEDEKEVYRMLHLQYIPPELREDRGEISAASEDRLPDLLELEEVKGDLHVHSDLSDGDASVSEIARRAKKRGYGYVGITDHSESLKVAGGLTAGELRESCDLVRRVSDGMEDFEVLQGVELDIKEDGGLDYPDEVLKDLDFVVGAVHSRFNMGREEMTERMVRAMSNEYLSIIAHPTGRILERREPYELDLGRVMEEAREQGVMLEVNCFPDRLDLKDVHCRMAKEAGVTLALGTDAHTLTHLDHMRYGVATARRGWIGPEEVVNTLEVDELRRRMAR